MANLYVLTLNPRYHFGWSYGTLIATWTYGLRINLVRKHTYELCAIYSQGSSAPFTIRSSIMTPVYPSARVRMNGGLWSAERPAFTPAITPCAAASSYPVVPIKMLGQMWHHNARRLTIDLTCQEQSLSSGQPFRVCSGQLYKPVSV